MDRRRRRQLEEAIRRRVEGLGATRGLRGLIQDSLTTVVPFLHILRNRHDMDRVERRERMHSYLEGVIAFLDVLQRRPELYVDFVEELWRQHLRDGYFERLLDALDPAKELKPPDSGDEAISTANPPPAQPNPQPNTSPDESSKEKEKVIEEPLAYLAPDTHREDRRTRGDKGDEEKVEEEEEEDEEDEQEQEEEESPDDNASEGQSEKAVNLGDEGNVLNKAPDDPTAPPTMSPNIDLDASKSQLSSKRMPVGSTASDAAEMSGDENPGLEQPTDEDGGGAKFLLPSGSMMHVDDLAPHSVTRTTRGGNTRAVSAESPRGGERSEPPPEASAIEGGGLLDDLQQMEAGKRAGLDVDSRCVAQPGLVHDGPTSATEMRSMSDPPPSLPSMTSTLMSSNQPSFLEDDTDSTPVKQTATSGSRSPSENISEVSDGSDRSAEPRRPVATPPEVLAQREEVRQLSDRSTGTPDSSVELPNSLRNSQVSSPWPSNIPHVVSSLNADSFTPSNALSSRGNVTDQTSATYYPETTTEASSSRASSFSIPSADVVGAAAGFGVSSFDGPSEAAVAGRASGQAQGSMQGGFSSSVNSGNPDQVNGTLLQENAAAASSNLSSRTSSSSIPSADVVGIADFGSASSDGASEAAVARSLSAQTEGSIRGEIAEPSSSASLQATPGGRDDVTNHLQKKRKCTPEAEADERGSSEADERGSSEEGDGGVDGEIADDQMEESVEPGRGGGNANNPLGFSLPQTVAFSLVGICIGVGITYMIMRRR